MKDISKRIVRLFVGLFLYSVGIVLVINANLGLAPWQVFHQGISKIFGITMGQASIGVGLLVLILDAQFGEKIGWGTVFNMFFIGYFMDILMLNNLLPTFTGFIPSLLMLFLGMLVNGVAMFCYIGAGFGSGPRDGLLVALTKKTNRSVGLVKGAIESSVLIIGYFLGGSVGIGTVISSLTTGYFVQFVFKVTKFDVTSVKHRYIEEDIAYMKGLLCKGKNFN